MARLDKLFEWYHSEPTPR